MLPEASAEVIKFPPRVNNIVCYMAENSVSPGGISSVVLGYSHLDNVWKDKAIIMTLYITEI